MAHIAIDARKYFDYGIGSYIQNLALALSELNTAHSYTMLVSPEDLSKINQPSGWHVKASAHGKYSVGEILLLGREARSAKVDLFHEPHYTLPVGLKGRSVVTVHDLIHVKMPRYFSLIQRAYAFEMLRHAVRHAGAVIAVSRRTKEDLIDTFKVKDENVAVVYHGIRRSFRRLEDTASIDRFRNSHGVQRPFLLYVGNIKPHKNIPGLLSAFSIVRSRFKSLELVFAGGSCLGDAALLDQARHLGITEAIRDMGRLDEDDLIRAYNAAELLILPSLYEGFGFPALEAMACGTAAIVSNAGSLPEVVGDAAMIIDPRSPDSLAEAISSLLADSEKKARLIARGRARAEQFSWEKTGRQTLSIYEKVLDRCRAR